MAVGPQRIVEFIVRSELIFRAREKVDNKYQLCQTTAKSTRLLHLPTTSTTVTINDALTRLAGDLCCLRPQVCLLSEHIDKHRVED